MKAFSSMRNTKILTASFAFFLIFLVALVFEKVFLGFYPKEIRKSKLSHQIQAALTAEDSEIDLRGLGNIEQWDEIAIVPAYQDSCDLNIAELPTCEKHSPTDDSLCLLLFLKANQFQFEILTNMKWDICKDDKQKRIPRKQAVLRR